MPSSVTHSLASAELIRGAVARYYVKSQKRFAYGNLTKMQAELGKISNGYISRKAPQNPFFLENGFGELAHNDHAMNSPYTKAYLLSRTLKNAGGRVASLGGSILSTVTQVNVVSIGKDAQAMGSSLAHAMKLKAIASGFKHSKTIVRWVDILVAVKQAKAGYRGAGLIASLSTIPGARAMLTAGDALVDKEAENVVLARIAMEIHWRARQEAAIGRGSSATIGPANAVLYEIFTKRTTSATLGGYDVSAFVREAGGWVAIYDKLTIN